MSKSLFSVNFLFFNLLFFIFFVGGGGGYGPLIIWFNDYFVIGASLIFLGKNMKSFGSDKTFSRSSHRGVSIAIGFLKKIRKIHWKKKVSKFVGL